MQQDSRHPYKSDPYRAVRKPPSPDGYYESPSYNSDLHSRSASESSTTRLAVSSTPPAGNSSNSQDYYCNQQDPYAPRQQHMETKKKKKSRQPLQQQQLSDKRANSYLPYSNHKRDPYNSVEPIHLQEEEIDDLPSFNSPNNRNKPVGSILQDNIVMDMMNENGDSTNYYYSPNKNQNNDNDYKKEIINNLPPNKKKSWWVKLGISGRKLVFIVFGFISIVTLVWYFVWPRTPTLAFLEAGLVSTANYTSTSMVATWSVNFTVNNLDNWIPTNINNFAVNVLDSDTMEVFGSGNSGPLMLSPRDINQIITVPIYINFTRDATSQTLIDLLNACGLIDQDLSNPMPKQTLDIAFSVVYYIAGISWHAVSTFTPQSYFQCPATST